jgi:D-proline reductase (dithiol) PrdB
MISSLPPVDYIQRTRDQYDALGYSAYRWVTNEGPPPWAPSTKPLSECRVALVGSGGVYTPGQVGYHFRDDASFRIIDSDTPESDLHVAHFAYDLTDARRDPNVVFPLGTLRGLVADGVVGSLAPRAYGFMGGIYSSRRVEQQLAPAIADRIIADQVDLVLLVPV